MSTAVEQATKLLQTIVERYGKDLIGILQDLSDETNKSIEMTILMVPGEEDAKVTMTISEVGEEAGE